MWNEGLEKGIVREKSAQINTRTFVVMQRLSAFQSHNNYLAQFKLNYESTSSELSMLCSKLPHTHTVPHTHP